MKRKILIALVTLLGLGSGLLLGYNVAVIPTDKKASNNKAFRLKKHRLNQTT